MKGIIMSGGVGSRLRPLTCNLPKPMVPIFNKPVVEYGVNLFKKYDVEDIGFTLFYLPDKIMDYFGDGSKFNFNANYYIEDTPLGTGGSVRNAEDFLDDTIIILSGDAFTDIDLKKAYEFHVEKGSKATLILKKEAIPLEYGVVVTDNEGRIIRFLEKPSWSEVFSDTVNTGIYILEPEVFDYYNKGEKFDFSKDLFPQLLKDDVPMYGYIAEEYWSDIGDLNSYIKTHEDILKDEEKHYLLGKAKEKEIWIGDNTIIERGVKLYPPVYIGKNCLIREGAVIEDCTVIGNNTIIDKNTSIKKSIIWEDVNISKNCEIRKAVICNNVYIGEHSRVFEGVAIGSYSKIFRGSTIRPNVKIWPHKKIDERVEVTENLIWAKGISKRLFGHRDISGIFNENITPEISVGLGIAFASVINRNGTYLISSDESNLSKVLKNAIISGVLSTGAQVVDIKGSIIPMCRFGIKKFKLDGGIHIRRDYLYEDMVTMEFFDKNGANIDKNTSKKMENTLAIEDFKRTTGREVGDIIEVDNFSAIYIKEAMELLKNLDKIKKQRPRIILYSESKNVSNLAEKYLKSIGCKLEIAKKKSGFKIEDIQEMVLKSSADLGIAYMEDGEKIQLTDGYNIVADEKYYLLSLLIGLKSGKIKDNILVPYNYPRIMEKLVKKHNGDIIYSKSTVVDLIQGITKGKMNFQYVLNFDGIWAIGMILDYLVENSISLNEVLKELPEYFYMEKEIPCQWKDKGNIIRRLSQEDEDKKELIEGVRFIEDRGWILIIPDEQKPVFNIYIEGYNMDSLEELWIKYHRKIKNMMKDL